MSDEDLPKSKPRSGKKTGLPANTIPSTALKFTDLVQLDRFRSKFSESLEFKEVGTDSDAAAPLASDWRSKIPTDVLTELKNSCNPSHLYARSTAPSIAALHPGIITGLSSGIQLTDLVANTLPPGALDPTPQASTLRSVLLFREELKRRAAQMAKAGPSRSAENNGDQSRNEEMRSATPQQEPETSAQGKPALGPHYHPPDVVSSSAQAAVDELVITIRVYRPFVAHRNYRTCLLGEYLLLGSQTLADLRDVIVCEFDYASLAGDLSERPTALTEGPIPIAKDKYPSAYFCINDTFYDDMRHPEAKSLSKVVVEHGQAHGQASFKTAPTDMAHSKLDKLTLKIGYPYLYVHQGNCEHLVVVTDVRMFNPATDCKLVPCYPVVLQRRRHFRRPCMCCWRLGAKWAVSNCILCPEDPTLLCGVCADRLLYDERGRKVPEAGPFRLYALPCVSLGSTRKEKSNTGGEDLEGNREIMDMPLPRDDEDGDDDAEDEVGDRDQEAAFKAKTSDTSDSDSDDSSN